MKRLLILLTAVTIASSLLAVTSAEAARRFGGGRSTGMQRQAPPQQAPKAPATQPDQAKGQQAASPAAVPPRSGASRWLGPLAAFGIGAGLMALFGGSMLAGILGNLLMLLLLVWVASFVIRMLRGKSPPPSQRMQYAGMPAGVLDASAPRSTGQPSFSADTASSERRYPAEFNVAGFLRQAKASFIRMQAANDAKDLTDIGDYTTPELYAELAARIQERGAANQRTEVVTLDATLLEVVTEGDREIASVRFSGLIREDDGATEPFDETWHVVKDVNDAKAPWVIAGIQVNEQRQ